MVTESLQIRGKCKFGIFRQPVTCPSMAHAVFRVAHSSSTKAAQALQDPQKTAKGRFYDSVAKGIESTGRCRTLKELSV